MRDPDKPPLRALELVAVALYAPLFFSALGAFVLAATMFNRLGVAQASACAAVGFLTAGAVWVRCGTIWNGEAVRIWPDLAGCAAFLALLISAARGFGAS